jgi:uncharacterized phage-associated protein
MAGGGVPKRGENMHKKQFYCQLKKSLTLHFLLKCCLIVNRRKEMIINLRLKQNKKAIEAIIYIARKYKNPEIYAICKLLYLVDKFSLEKYGRFLFNESYCAMEQGAVPSSAYDLLKMARKSDIDGIKVVNNDVVVSRNADISLFSESDIECLDQIVDAYNTLPGWALHSAAHDQAWKKNWEKRDNKKSIPIPITDIAGELEDSDNLIDYISNRG